MNQERMQNILIALIAVMVVALGGLAYWQGAQINNLTQSINRIPAMIQKAAPQNQAPSAAVPGNKLQPIAGQYFKDVQDKKFVPSATAKKMYFADEIVSSQMPEDIIDLAGCQKLPAPPEATAGIYAINIYTVSSSHAAAGNFYLSPNSEQDDFGNSWPKLYGPYQGTKQAIKDSFSNIQCVDDEGGTTAIPRME